MRTCTPSGSARSARILPQAVGSLPTKKIKLSPTPTHHPHKGVRRSYARSAAARACCLHARAALLPGRACGARGRRAGSGRELVAHRRADAAVVIVPPGLTQGKPSARASARAWCWRGGGTREAALRSAGRCRWSVCLVGWRDRRGSKAASAPSLVTPLGRGPSCLLLHHHLQLKTIFLNKTRIWGSLRSSNH